MNKRSFIKNSIIISSGTVIGANLLSCTSSSSSKSSLNDVNENLKPESFKLPELSFEYNELEPYIDAQTMETHYSKHHAGYTKKFNAAVKSANLEGVSAEKLFKKVSSLPEGIRNNGGGFYNHKLFWEILSPKPSEPSPELISAIKTSFGSLDGFKEEFSKAAATVFGSGWAWLILKDGKLEITSTANQDNPLMDVADVKGKPILCIDVWEHAYYLNYQNKRKDYISAFWNVVNWEKVSANLNL